MGGLAVRSTVGPSGHTISPHPSSREGLLSPDAGKLRVDLHGEIAAILRLARAGKNPACNLADRAEQLVMVAGAYNHRKLTLLPIEI